MHTTTHDKQPMMARPGGRSKPYRLGAALILLTAFATAPGWAQAARAETGNTPDASRDAPSDAASVQALLDQVATAGSGQERLDAAARLAETGAAAVAELDRFLQRDRRSSESDRRAMLTAIKADVPGKDGRFRTPKRNEKVNRGDDFDWLGALAELVKPGGKKPGLGELMADVAAVRALAASRQSAAAEVILAFTFTDDGLIYRDECGRYLRKMSPFSLPTLILASQDVKRDRSLRRYADYQLDRLDRQDPTKALSQAQEDFRLELEVIRAYGVIKDRGAFAPLLALTDHPTTELRDAARKAVMAYLTGREPKPAPKRKLVLPGGKLSDEEEPLWLNYRELADVELRRKHEEVFGERARNRDRPAELARKLFEHHDTVRAQKASEAYAAARGLADAGKWAEATSAFDRMLARDPGHPRRKDMARAYYEHARVLAGGGAWGDAAAAYSKAHGLNPEAEFAADAMASHHFALGKALDAEGKDGSAAFRRAKRATPEGTSLSAENPTVTEPGNRWMLYSGIGGGAVALILLILGLAVRQR